MADIEARLACASSFILQSPPGEVNDVFNDVRALVGDDTALETGILPALQKYNVEQLIVADLPDKQQQLLICSCGSVEGDESARFIEPATAKAWQFDHLRLTASDPVDIDVDQDCESIRSELETAASKYGKEHFSEGVSKVFTTEQRRLKSLPKPAPLTTAATPAAPEEALETAATPASEAGMQQDEAESGTLEEPELEPKPEPVDPDSAPPGEDAVATTETADSATGAAETEEPKETVDEPVDTQMTSDESKEPAQEESSTPTADAEVPSTSVLEEPTQSQSQPEEVTPPTETLPKKFSLFFVGNKYNPSNYWTGRWRSSYELDLSQAQPTLQGNIQINVHFFEQGNVQLSTIHKPSIPLPESVSASSSASDIAKAVLKAISKAEEEYQLELNEVYRDMADKTFRNLRRVLPVTRQKMDWAKVASYKMGRQLGGGKE